MIYSMENKREKLKNSKPLVYEKVMKFKEKWERGESIAIIQLQYNYTCNFRCQHCSIRRFQEKTDKSQLTIADVCDLYVQADKLGLARTTITGGEPLVFKDLEDLVLAINPQKFYINCDSNGWLLDEEKALCLKKLGVDRIQLSIDSLNAEEHDTFRGVKGAHYRAMRAVSTSLSVGLDIFIQTVVTKQRLYSKEFIGFLEYFNNMEIGVFVTYAKPVGAWEGNFDGLVDKEDMGYMKKLEEKYNVFTHLTDAYGLSFGCPAGRNIFSITQYGDVLICPYFHCSMGSIFEEPLKTILDRCLKLRPFQKNTCLLAEDRDFIDKYLIDKIYGKNVPVPWKEVFSEEDFK